MNKALWIEEANVYFWESWTFHLEKNFALFLFLSLVFEWRSLCLLPFDDLSAKLFLVLVEVGQGGVG